MALSNENKRRLAQMTVDSEIILGPVSNSEQDIARFDEQEVDAVAKLDGYVIEERHRRWWVNRHVINALRVRRLK